jgi:hypothetical protein
MNNKKNTTLNEDIVIRNILNRIRGEQVKTYITESVEQDAIAITNDPKFGQEVLKNQIEEFRSAVDGGAQFSNEKSDSPLSAPLVYIPSENNLVFSGTIPSLNNLKWQFKLKDSDGTGLFIQTDNNSDELETSGKNSNKYPGLRLSEENLKKLNKLLGHYKNWKTQWEQSSGMLETLGKNND